MRLLSIAQLLFKKAVLTNKIRDGANEKEGEGGEGDGEDGGMFLWGFRVSLCRLSLVHEFMVADY